MRAFRINKPYMLHRDLLIHRQDLGRMKIAADKIELENIPAKEALDEAQRVAQKALDEINK